ncbi:MAG: hypothetical protein DHS20C14_11500 [Phycisphaeraceae bacterium]|nr:MAG: hypothetical protein DHS20C14_11500 [Phycisphaeraceae bacterium]
MIPNASDIVRWRAAAFGLVRFVGVVLAFQHGGSLAMTVVYALDGSLGFGMAYVAPSIAYAVVMFLLALTFVIVPGSWARWLVPSRSSSACPGCRYPLHDLATPQCPECGLELTPEFLPGGAAAPGIPPGDLTMRAKARAMMIPVSRLAGVVLVLVYGFGATMDVLEVFFDGLGYGLDDREGTVAMVYRLAGAALGLFMIFGAERFAHWLAFGLRREPEDAVSG